MILIGTKTFTMTKLFSLDFGIWLQRKAWAGPGSKLTGAGGLCRQTETHRKTRLGELVSEKSDLVYFYSQRMTQQVN